MKCLQFWNKFSLCNGEGYGAFSPGSRSLLCSFYVALFCCVASGLFAQNQKISGSWRGELDLGIQKLPLVFHFQAQGDAWEGTLDSPQQNATGIPISEIRFEDPMLFLRIDTIGASYEAILSGEILQGTFKQAGMELPLSFRPQKGEDTQTFKRPQTPQGPFSYDIVHTGFLNQAENILLRGTLTLPTGTGPFPGVILVSGSGPQNRNGEVFSHQPLWVLADYLTRKGIAVLRYDDRGVGESEGVFKQATTRDLMTDAWAALRKLKTIPKVDTLRLGVIGHSEGGLIAWMMAAEQSKDLSFIAALAPPVVPIDELMAQQTYDLVMASGASEELALEQMQTNRKLYQVIKNASDQAEAKAQLTPLLDTLFLSTNPDTSALAAERKRLYEQYAPLTSPWFFHFIKIEPEAFIRTIQIPAWVAFGKKDRQVSAAINRQALEAMDKASFDIHSFENLNHLFQSAPTGAVSEYGEIEETMNEPMLDKLATWIRQQPTNKTRSSP
ncbi:alpha/beta hydrolase family protein [Cyclobacterium jeungdonense]|uniref:Alpha/beta fold hydrolase n=1 Tax=Cyclobacterium jeungdonense TaxID=708087 RepID=A0ABT8C5J1_9BACT|nr:alpha/beta hydrolase [Cyclobacterium jeungdonense]MDN3687367.1 alpha/beta fold hydrolase [Cyclobacterium jeungdonense]